MNQYAVSAVLVSAMLCVTALVWHGDIPGSSLLSAAAVVVALISRLPGLTAQEKAMVDAITTIGTPAAPLTGARETTTLSKTMEVAKP